MCALRETPDRSPALRLAAICVFSFGLSMHKPAACDTTCPAAILAASGPREADTYG
jgi:hypothetical protein